MRIIHLFIYALCSVVFLLSSIPIFAADTGRISVIVSEDIPGAGCICKAPGGDCKKVVTRKYECFVEPGPGGLQQMIANILQYIVKIVLLLGVLAIVGLGIAWSFAGGDDVKMKSTLKSWAINILIGLTILFFFSYILRFIAPWVYQ